MRGSLPYKKKKTRLNLKYRHSVVTWGTQVALIPVRKQVPLNWGLRSWLIPRCISYTTGSPHLEKKYKLRP